MSVHEQFAEDLALYALGALDGEAKVSIEKHVQECAPCRRELEQLRGDTALFALSSAGPRPPERAKARLMDAIAQEPRSKKKKSGPSWWGVLGWVATAAIAIFAAMLWQQNAQLKKDAAEADRSFEQRKGQLEKAAAMATILQSPDAQRYDVMPASWKTPPPPSGKAIYSRDHGLVFIATNIDALPAQKAYELWLIPRDGSLPIPAGMFKPDAHGNVALMHSMPTGTEAKAFAVTIEPEQGSATPTMPIVLLGAGG